MYKNDDFNFSTTISREHYESKQDALACLSEPGAKAINRIRMAWMEHVVSLDEFMQLATSGYCFCNLFKFDPTKKYWIESKDGKWRLERPLYLRGANKGYMKMSFKADKFFRGAQTIFVDVDYTRFEDVQDYLATLTIPPTCVYMSFSDKKEKTNTKIVSRRFRMVYIFSEILNAKEFLYISRYITKRIEADTGEPMDDDCGTRKSQYMNGVFGNNETYRSDYIYSKDDFAEGGLFSVLPPDIEDVDATNEAVEAVPMFDKRMVADMERLSYDEFMHYNSWKYRYFYRTEKPDWIINTYQFTDENFLRLFYYLETVKDGEHRRRKLFYAACLRRLMYPEVDANTLLFNLYVDRERFYDNSDGVITITHLKRKVLRVMQMSIEELVVFCGSSIAYWKVNRPRIIFKPGSKFNLGLVRTVYKKIRYAEIDEQYDPQMSVRENMEAGLDVPQSTLYRYCRERGYQTDPNRPQSIRKQQEMKRKEKLIKIENFTRLYDTSLTPNENLELLAQKGLLLSYSTLMRWKNLYIAPPIPFINEPVPHISVSIDFDRYPQLMPTQEEMETEKREFEKDNWPNFWNCSHIWPSLG